MLLDQSSNQLLKTHFLGRDNFVWWIGQIADKKNSGWEKSDLKNKEAGKELYYNRVKVRIFGYHTANCDDLPDDKLPWAHILVPPGEANGVGKIGKAHSYQGGETVVGFFLDGDDAQQPVIFGSLYKSSEIKSTQKTSDLCASFEPYDPNPPDRHNSLGPSKPAGKNVGTGKGDENAKAVPSSGNSSGIDNVASDRGTEEKTTPAGINFSDKVDNKTTQANLCNNNRFARITAAIEELLKKIKQYQIQAGNIYNTVRGKVTNFTSEIRKVAGIISGDISTYIKEGMKFLFEKLSTTLGLTFGGLFPKTKQSEIGKIIDLILEAIYAIFKQVSSSLPDIVGDALTNFIGNSIGPTLCAIQNFVGQLLGKVLNTIENSILPILDQLNSLVQGALGSVANLLQSSLNLIGVINQLLNYADPKKYCAPPQLFSITQGISFSIVGDIKGLVSSVGDIGKLGGDLAKGIKSFGDLKLDLNSCNSKSITCGPPKIIISGGGGSGAAANAVVNSIGQVIGAIMTNTGSGYVEPPKVSVFDPCEIGFGANAEAILGIGTTSTTPDKVVQIVFTDPGQNYLQQPVTETYGNTGIGSIAPSTAITDSNGTPYTATVVGAITIDPGYGYDDNTKITIGDCDTKVKVGLGGGIENVTAQAGCAVSTYPEVTINSANGAAAQLAPILQFNPIAQVGIGTSIVKVIDCV